MAISKGTSSSHQSYPYSPEQPNTPEPHPQATDLARNQHNTQNPGTDPTSTSRYTGQPRRTALQGPSPELFAEHIRGPSTSATQVGRDFYVSYPRDYRNNRLSLLADVASLGGGASGPDLARNWHGAHQQHLQHQKSQTNSQAEPHTDEQSISSHEGDAKSHNSTVLSSGARAHTRPHRRRPYYPWNNRTDQFLLEQAPKVYRIGSCYSWPKLLRDFKNRDFGFVPCIKTLKQRYKRLEGDAREAKTKAKKDV